MLHYWLISIILTLAVILGYVNYRLIHLPASIAIMAGALMLSLLLICLGLLGFNNVITLSTKLVKAIDLQHLLLNGLLSFLLFAGAITIDIDALFDNKWEILALSTLGTLASTLLIGSGLYALLQLTSFHLNFLDCLLFGAIISPTDPIAVLAIFKEIKLPQALTICVAGESLFNDGMAIVIFTTLMEVAVNGQIVSFSHVVILFIEAAMGGIAYGYLIGRLCVHWIKPIRDPKLIVMITLVIVTAGYGLAIALSISGPLAMVVSGIMVGHALRQSKYATPHKQQSQPLHGNSHVITSFWAILDEALNAILFLLIGLELITLKITTSMMIVSLAVIPLTLVVRAITVAIPIKLIQLKREHPPYTIRLLTWGGLRGGLAVALALGIPPSDHRQFILAITYAVVVFSVLVQGLTIKPLAKLANAKLEHP